MKKAVNMVAMGEEDNSHTVAAEIGTTAEPNRADT